MRHTHNAFLDQKADVKHILHRLSKAARVDDVLEQRDAAVAGHAALLENALISLTADVVLGEAGSVDEFAGFLDVFRQMAAYTDADCGQAVLIRLLHVLLGERFRSGFAAGRVLCLSCAALSLRSLFLFD